MDTSPQPSHPTHTPAALGGIMIIAGTSIGAGMFSLPMMSAGVWFSWTTALLLVVAFFLYSSGLYLCEVAFKFPLGAHYTTMATKTLGQKGHIITLLCVGFVCYILTYAYISGASSVIRHTFEQLDWIQISSGEASALFALLLGMVVFLGTKYVDKITTAMLGGMIFTFFSSFTGLTQNIETEKLFPLIPISDSYIYIGSMLPVLVVSFGFHTAVPSLIKHFNADTTKVLKSIRYGLFITIAVYLCWIFSVFGLVTQVQMVEVMHQGGNIGQLIQLLQQLSDSVNLDLLIQIFSELAIASSFLGVSLGLFDFIADLFKLSDHPLDRIKTACITFLPPTLLGIYAPNGYLIAMGYAALIAAMFLVVLPCLMAIKARKDPSLIQSQGAQFKVKGGSIRLYFTLIFGCIVILCEMLHISHILPVYA